MKRFILGLLLAVIAPLYARAQYPYFPVIQSTSANSSGATTCTFPNPVRNGSIVLIVGSWWQSTNSASVSQSRGSNLTQLLYNNGGGGGVGIMAFAGLTTSAGSETLTPSISGSSWHNWHCLELPPYWQPTVTDGTGSTTWSGAGSVSSPNVTPTVLNDFVIGWLGGGNNTGCGYATSGNITNFTVFADCGSAAYTISTNLSATNITFNNSGSSGLIGTVALKSNALAVTSPATAPGGSLTNAYDWFLQASGGVSTYTWSITSGTLQTGLSLNTSTGEISGTPTVSATRSITFQVSDGTSTASKAISLTVGGSANTITVVQSQGGGTYGSNVTSGSLLVVGTNQGGINGAHTASCTDTLGTEYNHIGWGQFSDTTAGDLLTTDILAGVAPSGGANTILCNNATPQGFSLELSGASYAAYDNQNVTTTHTSSSPQTIGSSTLTTLVPNQILIASGTCWTAGCTDTVQSPFTSVSTTAVGGGYRIVTTVTGYTVSYITNTASATPALMLLAGIRPSAGAVSAAATQIGGFTVGP
jgi:hypothetical protein